MKVRVAYGRVIRRARHESSLTLRELAVRAHISHSHLGDIENGQKEASSEHLGAILSSLEIPPSEFFDRVAGEYRRAPGTQ